MQKKESRRDGQLQGEDKETREKDGPLKKIGRRERMYDGQAGMKKRGKTLGRRVWGKKGKNIGTKSEMQEITKIRNSE